VFISSTQYGTTYVFIQLLLDFSKSKLLSNSPHYIELGKPTECYGKKGIFSNEAKHEKLERKAKRGGVLVAKR
jgi:hypothetical protein